MEWHPASRAFPMMEDTQLQELADDIRRNGQHVDIEVDEHGRIIDGRNRSAACEIAQVEPRTRTVTGLSFEQVKERCWSLNVMQRMLTKSQRDAAAVKMASIVESATRNAKKRQRAGVGEDGSGGRGNKKTLAPVGAKVSRPHKASEAVAAKAGTSARAIERAQAVQKNAPDLLEQMEAGKLTTNAAYNQMRKRQKKAELDRKAEQAAFLSEQPEWTLINSDVLDGLRSVRDHHNSVRLIVTDPPYNIGVDYGSGAAADRRNSEEYVDWVSRWVAECMSVLADDGSLWVVINDEYAADYVITLRDTGFVLRSWVKWYEAFGVNQSNNFNRTSRHILYAVRDPKRFVFNPSEVSRPSDRQAIYNDKRAASDGKILDDVWLDIPRLTGTSSERMPDFPTQLPVALMSRIVRCASEPGDLVVDPFNGSGTTAVACIQSNRK